MHTPTLDRWESLSGHFIATHCKKTNDKCREKSLKVTEWNCLTLFASKSSTEPKMEAGAALIYPDAVWESHSDTVSLPALGLQHLSEFDTSGCGLVNFSSLPLPLIVVSYTCTMWFCECLPLTLVIQCCRKSESKQALVSKAPVSC